ncbi:hypothetical protein SLS58_007177 [Diplodia intermedia]|uniref:Chromo domain-containing protein n=1 Tax=Diplodia intermedia TaxID=856260 RepID=A0ABR3TL39_9PEZI
MARPLLSRVNAVATVADKAAHNRANRAAKRTRSASVPADRIARNARTASSSTAASSKSKATKKTNTKKKNAAAQSEETYVALAILEEDAKRGYLIDWAGLDGNGEPYEPTWEPKSYANAALKRDWKEKKERKWKKPAESNGEGQVGDIANGEAQRGEKEVEQDEVQPDGLQDEAQTVQDKPLPNRSRKEAAQKRASPDNKPSIDERMHDPKEEAQNNDAQNGTEPDQPSINGRRRKREADNGTQKNELPESSDRNRKRKLDTERANAQDKLEPSFAIPHTQPDNKKQRLQATRTESAKPESTKPEFTKPEFTKPEFTKPESTKLEFTKPESTKPESTKPESTKPDSTKPDSIKPKAKPPNQKSTKPEPEPQDEGVFPARAITGEKPRYYRVAWEKDPVTGEDFEDTWEPKGNVSQDLVAEWKQQQKGQSQKAPKKPRGRPAKKAPETEDKQLKEEQDDDVYSARAIVDERPRHYLVAWEKDPKTGEDFDDSWEPKSNVSKDLVAEWRQKKKTAPKQQEQQMSKSPKKPKGKVASQTVDTPKQTERQTEKGEQQRKQNAIALPTEPVTPLRDEDEEEEEEEEDEASYPPSSTMKYNTVPVDDTPTTDKRTSEESGFAHSRLPANAAMTHKKQIEKAPGIDIASPFWEQDHDRSKPVVLYGTKGRRLLTDLQ